MALADMQAGDSHGGMVRWAKGLRSGREAGEEGQSGSDDGVLATPVPEISLALSEAGPAWGRQQWGWWRATRTCQRAREGVSGDAEKWGKIGAGACTCNRVHRRTWDCVGAAAESNGRSVSPWRAANAGDVGELRAALARAGSWESR